MFRNASDETTSSAINEFLKNGVTEDSKFPGRYAISVWTFRSFKQCNIICLLPLHEHVAEGTKQPNNITPHQLTWRRLYSRIFTR
jgi:hypothetical protein